MTLVRLPRSNKHVKRFIRRMEAYHKYKVQSAFTEYYENEPIGILHYIEDESFLPKRKPKRKRKRKNIK
jgi:hypothetical protein